MTPCKTATSLRITRLANWAWLPIGLILLTMLLASCSSGGSAPVDKAAPASPAAGTQSGTAGQPAAPANPELILATTTSTQDSGLLDVLIPMFEKQSGYKVKTVAVGSGQAMTMGERGEADVMLVHAPDSEVKFMQAGNGVDRKLVMHNDFVIVGPSTDPAKIKGVKTAKEALTKIAASEASFISRGDNSGTQQMELKLWQDADIDPKGKSWYKESGQGMGATLNVTSEKAAYTLSDRATYLASKKNIALDILVEGDANLLNIYHVITVNPSKSPKINVAGANAFRDFMLASDTQKTIAAFGVDKYGQPLFFADAGKPEFGQ